MDEVTLVTPEAITKAAERLAGRVVRTPLVHSARLSDELGVEVYLKPENLQHTGSFKVRGAINALLARAEAGALPIGVVTFSAGNHAAATSFAARSLDLPVIVCMPPGAVATKVEAVRRYGGEIVFTDDLVGSWQSIAADRGYTAMHPFDDPDVIAGHGTVGTEILADLPQAGTDSLVVVPVGGGGLISGVASGLRHGGFAGRVVGVEPQQANAVSYGLRQGAPEPPPVKQASLADGLAPPFAGVNTLAHIKARVDTIVEITEDDIRAGWWAMLDTTKMFVEPSGATGLAAIMAGAIEVPHGGRVVLVLTGGNAARTALAQLS
ncbi:MAG TPA: pyridoxal-phosphate dependent enzyme [Micromonosporaceae bacterium]